MPEGNMGSDVNTSVEEIKQPKKPRKKPWPIIAGAVLILVAVGAGARYYFDQKKDKTTSDSIKATEVAKTSPTPSVSPSVSPTPADETANWKTYTNSTYNFSINILRPGQYQLNKVTR